MELLELTEKLQKIFCANRSNFNQKIMDIIFSENKNDIFCSYLETVNNDLSKDYLQKIFQYYYSDRDEKCQDFTPFSISKLVAELAGTGKVIYDLCSGSGALTIQAWANNPEAIFICEELDENVIPSLLFNLAVRNINGYVINRNALTLELRGIYELKAGKRFSDIRIKNEFPDMKADIVISNPPYNIKWEPPTPLFADSRFLKCEIPPANNANYAFILTALDRLQNDGRAVFVLPNGVLSSGGKEANIRKYLIENGLIERAITLPDNMFEDTKISTCILVLSQNNKNIALFDARQKYEIEEREQRGQFGGKSHKNRVYKKQIKTLNIETIHQLCGACDEVQGFSCLTDKMTVAENDYMLAPSCYIKFEEKEMVHRPYVDIISDINRIAKERNALRITMNETLAKQLGLYEIAQQENKAQDLNETFNILGGSYENKKYIVLSKNKNEFKIENQDKENISSLLYMFFPMWKQHVFYLNNEENRLLAELRDALLPDLMSGKLELNTDNAE